MQPNAHTDFDIIRKLARENLSTYASILHPSWEPNWHHRVIANIMGRVAAAAGGDDRYAQYRRVCIQMPPRAGKTELITKLFPGWYLAQHPYHNIISASYGAELADVMGRKAREYATSDTFQNIFDMGVSRLTNAITKWELENHAGFFATSVGAALTGFGANCLVAGTMVLTNKGETPIEEICRDITAYKVWAFADGEGAFCDVEAMREDITGPIYTITTSEMRVVHATGDHLFYVEGNGWVPARELEGGDILVAQSTLPEGSMPLYYDTVASVVEGSDDRPTLVFDIQVAGKHTFFANGILVHNCLIIDDPLKNASDAASQSVKDSIWDWFMSTAYTRLEKNAATVVVQTRWATDDLIGRLLMENENAKPEDRWLNISFPMVAERDEKYREKGEPLWPGKYDLEQCERIKTQVGKRVWAALYQQRPAPDEGAIFLKDYFRYYEVDELDDLYFSGVFQSWDTGISAKETSARSACTTWGVVADPSVPGGSKFYLLNVYADQLAFPDLKRKVQELARLYSPDTVWVEEKATGRPIIDELRLAMGGLLKGVNPIGDKVQRAKAVSAVFEAGRVFLPTGLPWVRDYLGELTTFPYGQYADKVDSTTQALRMMLKAQYQAARGRSGSSPYSSWMPPVEPVSIYGR